MLTLGLLLAFAMIAAFDAVLAFRRGCLQPLRKGIYLWRSLVVAIMVSLLSHLLPGSSWIIPTCVFLLMLIDGIAGELGSRSANSLHELDQ